MLERIDGVRRANAVEGVVPQNLYDSRYAAGYMEDFPNLYETTRLQCMRDVLARLRANGFVPETCLDYGCGGGRWFGMLREQFPDARITGSDISTVALEQARERHPDAELVEMSAEPVSVPDESFDLVLEHVTDVALATAELGRVLRPGGVAVISTPCADRFSLEWILNRLTGGLQPSADGYGRFASDEPGHLRRLSSSDLTELLARAGLGTERVYHSAHLFTTLAVWPERIRGYQRIPLRLRAAIARLDWHLFRRLSNGATMIAVAAKERAPVPTAAPLPPPADSPRQPVPASDRA
jgi:SAM-dependent methyltransferase